MKRRIFLAIAAALTLAQAPESIPGPTSEPTGPQPELPKEKLVIVTQDGAQHVFNVEMAVKPEQQSVGEMFRTSVPKDGGMLFDWGFPHPVPMWMRNTLVPLDMVFINPDGTIHAIAEDTTPRSLAPIDSHGPVRAILELAGGVTAKLDIRVGDTVKQRIFGNAASPPPAAPHE